MAEVVVAAAQAAGDGRGRALALWRAARLGSARPRWMRPPAPARPDQARPSRAVSAICRRRAHEVLRSAASAAPPHPRSPRVRPRTRSLPASLTRPLAHARGISTEPTDLFRPPGPVPPPVQSTSDLLSQISPRNYFPPPPVAAATDGCRRPSPAQPAHAASTPPPLPFCPPRGMSRSTSAWASAASCAPCIQHHALHGTFRRPPTPNTHPAATLSVPHATCSCAHAWPPCHHTAGSRTFCVAATHATSTDLLLPSAAALPAAVPHARTPSS